MKAAVKPRLRACSSQILSTTRQRGRGHRGRGRRRRRHVVGGPSRLGIHEQLPLDQAVLAHRKMEAGEVFGRIVLIPPGS